MATTTVLQITDAHLLSDPAALFHGVPTGETLRAVLDDARRRVPDPARVVWSGDLSHEHTAAGYRRLRDALGDWVDRSLFMMGNHDDRPAMRAVFPGVPGEGDEPVRFREDVGPWRLVAVDTHVPGEVAGRISAASLAWARADLLDDPTRPTALFLHHPPISVESPWMDALRLLDADALEPIARACSGLRATFCGHVHHEFASRFGGAPCHTTPATSIQFMPRSEVTELEAAPPGCRVIRLHDDGTFETEVLRLARCDWPPARP